MLYNLVRSKMYKLLFLFFMFVSSPLYSNEFTFHCDSEDNLHTMVFDINPIEETVVHTNMIQKQSKIVYDINESMEIYYWDKENNSVWFLNYNDYFGSPPSLQMTLLNFERQKMFNQKMFNETLRSGEYKPNSPFSNTTYDCYMME